MATNKQPNVFTSILFTPPPSISVVDADYDEEEPPTLVRGEQSGSSPRLEPDVVDFGELLIRPVAGAVEPRVVLAPPPLPHIDSIDSTDFELRRPVPPPLPTEARTAAMSSVAPVSMSTSELTGDVEPLVADRPRGYRPLGVLGLGLGALGMAGVLWLFPASAEMSSRTAQAAAPSLVASVQPESAVPSLGVVTIAASAPATGAESTVAPSSARGEVESGDRPREQEESSKSQTESPSSSARDDATLPPFDRAAAARALDAAASAALSCRPADFPHTSSRVSVTFAPSGRVTTATVNGAAFAGTDVGGCIARAFRGAKVSPFSGALVTVHKTFVF